ncbi:MAG: hypothetical protein OXU20_09260, partial [Myxococcales bacterium]|nr:hypothetical protein [Myxococcales bacterium]
SEHPPNKLGGAFLWMAPRVGVDRMLSRIAPFERPFGMVRCSLGVASNFEDASRWIAFLKGFLDAEYVGALTRAYAERFQPPTTLC